MTYQPLYLRFHDEAEFDAICRDAEGNLLPWVIWTTPNQHIVTQPTGQLDADGQKIRVMADGFHAGGWVRAEDADKLPTLAAWTVTPQEPQTILQQEDE